MGKFSEYLWWLGALVPIAILYSMWRSRSAAMRAPRIAIRIHDSNPQPSGHAVPGVFATIVNERHDIPARLAKISLLGGHTDSDEWHLVSRYSPMPHVLPPDDSLKIQFDMLEAIERTRYDYLRVEVETTTGSIIRSEPVRQFFR